MRSLVLCIAVLMLLSVSAAGLAAEQNQHGQMMREPGAAPRGAPEPELNTIDDLKQEIKALRNRVATLEALKPSLAGFMPNFAERFHVAHRAGDAEDWAVAAHEVDEMTRLVGLVKHIDAKDGQLMEGFMTGYLRQLRAAVEHSDKRAFGKALGATIASCNACHQATGSTIQVTLDVDESLSMRHPHAFRKSTVPKEHMH